MFSFLTIKITSLNLENKAVTEKQAKKKQRNCRLKAVVSVNP